MSNLRDAALNADDITTEVVDVPEWGHKYGVKALTIEEQREFITAVSKKEQEPDGTWQTSIDRDKYAVQLLLRTVVDPDTGETVFEPADAAALNKKSGRAVSRLLTVAARLAGLGGDDQMDETVVSLDETPDSDTG